MINDDPTPMSARERFRLLRSDLSPQKVEPLPERVIEQMEHYCEQCLRMRLHAVTTFRNDQTITCCSCGLQEEREQL